jgi:hypothetical protein
MTTMVETRGPLVLEEAESVFKKERLMSGVFSSRYEAAALAGTNFNHSRHILCHD